MATRERDLCVLYLNLIARLAAQICQEQTGDSKRKWKDEGPGTVGHKQLKLTVTLLTIVHCSLCCHCCTVALTLCTIANHKSQLARPNQAVNVLSLSLKLLSCFVCLVCFGHCGNTFNIWQALLPPLICHILHVEVVWELRLGPKFACQIPFKYSKCHRVASAFVVGNDFVTAISICLTVCLALRLLSCCCQEVVPGCPGPPFLCWLATICLLLLLPCITLCL